MACCSKASHRGTLSVNGEVVAELYTCPKHGDTKETR